MIEKHSWVSLRHLVIKIFPQLAAVIDELNPEANKKLFLVKYPYGSIILNKGVFQLPNNERFVVPLEDYSISAELKSELGYSGTIPLGLVVKNSIETCVQSKHRILPAALIGAGKLVSLWRVLEEGSSYYLGPFWSIISGARSICMLPKITDTANHRNLKIKYGLKDLVPQKLSDQWNIFRQISNHKKFSEQWFSEIIFFSKEWFAHKNDKHWSEFYRFLLNEVWQTTSHRRNQFILDFAFSIAQENRNLKPNPYIADTVKHLISIGNGIAPSFVPAIDDSAAPVSGLQKTYLEDYGLKKYAPVIMHLHHLSQNDQRPVYYSFQIPTTTVFSPKSRKLLSVMKEIQELKYIMETMLNEILMGRLGVERTPLYDLAKNINYSYYHSDKDKLEEIQSISVIPKFDTSFTKTTINNYQYEFPEFGPFFRGCISISYK